MRSRRALSMLSQREPTLRVERQDPCWEWFCGFENPPSQGDSGCLVESLSWISQLSAREACLSKMLTDIRRQSHARLTVNRT